MRGDGLGSGPAGRKDARGHGGPAGAGSADASGGVLRARHSAAPEPSGTVRSWRGVTPAASAAHGPDRAREIHACFEASSTTVMSEGAPTRTGGPHAPAPRVTYNCVSP